MKTLFIALKIVWAGAETYKLKFKLILSLLVGIANGVMLFFLPLSLAWLVKALTDGGDALLYFWILVAASLIMVLLKFIRRFFLESTINTIPTIIRVQYYKKLFAQSYSWHLNNNAGFFLAALNQVCGSIKQWLQTFPDKYIPNTVMGILFFAYTWTISPVMFLFFLCSLVGVIVFGKVLHNLRMKIATANTVKQIAFDRTFIDFLNNIRSVKKMDLLDFTYGRLTQRKNDLNAQSEKFSRYNGNQWGFIELCIELLFLIPIGYLVYRAVMGYGGIDTIVLFASMQPRIGGLTQYIMLFMEDVSFSYVQYDILAHHLEKVTDCKSRHQGKYRWKKIIFENTKFCFKKDNALFTHCVPKFVINKGDHIAVVGKSGEGKSTFLNMLAGLFRVQSGNTMVDEKTFHEIGPDFFTRTVAYISQDVELFDMTLFDNVTLGRNVSKRELDKVIHGCCLDELVRRSGTMHINIGEKGMKVSAGEKQRINLARGLLLNKDILILDEITANIDADTTKKIWNFIFSEYKDKTIVAVSHEKELLNHVDRRLRFVKGVGREEL